MDVKIELRHFDSWRGKYRGVNFEIIKWQFQIVEKDNWNYYLIINEQQFPIEVRDKYVLPPLKDEKGRLYYEYGKSDDWSNIDAHCGWTFYDILGGHANTPRVVKIGCDYTHLWDEGRRYDEEGIIQEVKQSIDMLHEAVAGFLIWSEMNGNYRTEIETEIFNTKYLEARKDNDNGTSR